LLNNFVVAAWIEQMLRELSHCDYAEIVLVVLNGPDAAPNTQSLLSKIIKFPYRTIRNAVERLLDIADKRLAEGPASLPDTFAPQDITNILGGVPQLRVSPIRTKWSDRIPPEQCEQIRSFELDVLVRVGFRILRGDILGCARAGVWSFHHGDNLVNRGGPPGYWEVTDRKPNTGCILQVLSEDLDNGLVLERTWSATNIASLSDSLRGLYWKSMAMLPRQLERLARLGVQSYLQQAKAIEGRPYLYSNRLFRRPSIPLHLGHIAIRLSRRIFRSIRSRLTHDQWILMYQFSDFFASSLWRYKKIIPPKGRFYADPFPVQWQGRFYVFFEEYLESRGKGHISVLEIDRSGPIGTPEPVLAFEEHLSYPFTFEADGQLWMVPECRQRRSVSLYRCVKFPLRWEKVVDLLTNVDAVDASLHYRDSRWWLFVNIASNKGAPTSDELFLFHSHQLESSNWQPHPQNPIVSDVRRARPAGRLFGYSGRLYRPSQDCSQRYGWALNFSEVQDLTTETYREAIVSKAEPNWASDVVAVHTFNMASSLYVVDAQIRRFRRR
jgi:hypothetical protein